MKTFVKDFVATGVVLLAVSSGLAALGLGEIAAPALTVVIVLFGLWGWHRYQAAKIVRAYWRDVLNSIDERRFWAAKPVGGDWSRYERPACLRRRRLERL